MRIRSDADVMLRALAMGTNDREGALIVKHGAV